MPSLEPAWKSTRNSATAFSKEVYQAALERELIARGIPFEPEVKLQVYYKGEPLDCWYEADFICFGEVIVELKALANLGGNEYAQIINYLKATGLNRGLLINFSAPQLEFKRFGEPSFNLKA